MRRFNLAIAIQILAMAFQWFILLAYFIAKEFFEDFSDFVLSTFGNEGWFYFTVTYPVVARFLFSLILIFNPDKDRFFKLLRLIGLTMLILIILNLYFQYFQYFEYSGPLNEVTPQGFAAFAQMYGFLSFLLIVVILVLAFILPSHLSRYENARGRLLWGQALSFVIPWAVFLILGTSVSLFASGGEQALITTLVLLDTAVLTVSGIIWIWVFLGVQDAFIEGSSAFSGEIGYPENNYAVK